MVIPYAAPRSAWMGGFLSLTGQSSVAKAGQVTFIYIALLTIQIVSKHLTVSSSAESCALS